MASDEQFSERLEIRLEPSTMQELREIAKANDRKLSDEVRRALRLHLLNPTRKKAA